MKFWYISILLMLNGNLSGMTSSIGLQASLKQLCLETIARSDSEFFLTEKETSFELKKSLPQDLALHVYSYIKPNEKTLKKLLKSLIQPDTSKNNFINHGFSEWLDSIEKIPLTKVFKDFSYQDIDKLPWQLQELIIANDTIYQPLPLFQIHPTLKQYDPRHSYKFITPCKLKTSIHPPENRYFSMTFDHSFEIIDPAEGAIKIIYKSPNGSHVVILLNDTLNLINLDTGEEKQANLKLTGNISRLSLLEDAKLLIIGYKETTRKEKLLISKISLSEDNFIDTRYPKILLAGSPIGFPLTIDDFGNLINTTSENHVLWPLLDTWLSLAIPLGYYLLMKKMQTKLTKHCSEEKQPKIIEKLKSLKKNSYLQQEHPLHNAIIHHIDTALYGIEEKSLND